MMKIIVRRVLLIRFSRQCLIAGLGIFVAAQTSVFGAKGDDLNIIGFSPDGKYVSFIFSWSQNESGLVNSELYIIDVARNAFALNPLKSQIEEEHINFEIPQKQLIDKAKEQLGLYHIVSGSLGEEVYGLPLSGIQPRDVEKLADAPMTVKFNGYRVTLSTMAFKDAYCTVNDPDYQKLISGLRLKLTNEKTSVTTILQEDTRVPKSRHCPLDYRIRKILLYKGRIAVFLAFFSPGFEGPNIKYLAVTGLLN